MAEPLTVADRRVLDAMAAVPRSTLERTLRNTLHDDEHGRAAARAELARRDEGAAKRATPPRLERAHMPPTLAEIVAVENVLRAQRPPYGAPEPVVVDLTTAELGVVHAALAVASVAAAEPDAVAAARVGWVELIDALVQTIRGGKPLSPDARARLCRVDLITLERMATSLAGDESPATTPHCPECGGTLARCAAPDGERGYHCPRCNE